MPLPKKDWNSRIGIKGESVVRVRLSEIALITKYEEDVGIDFIGILLDKEDDKFFTPNRTFYAQVKSTSILDKNFSTRIKVSTINHWLDREAPVFLFLVDVFTERVYWVSIEDIRQDLIKRIDDRRGNSFIKIKFDDKKELKKENTFLFPLKVRADSNKLIRLRAAENFRFALRGKGYVKKMPMEIIDENEMNLARDYLRMIAVACADYHFRLYRKGRASDLKKSEEYLKAIWYVDKSHYEIPYVLSLIYQEMKENKEALYFLQKSIEIMKDPDFIKTNEGKLIHKTAKINEEVLKTKLRSEHSVN